MDAFITLFLMGSNAYIAGRSFREGSVWEGLLCMFLALFMLLILWAERRKALRSDDNM